MTATIAHSQNRTNSLSRRWIQVVTLLVAVAAIIVAVVALVAANDSPATVQPRPAGVAATSPSFECTPRIAFARC